MDVIVHDRPAVWCNPLGMPLVSGDDAADVVMLSCTNVRALAVLPMLRDAAGLDVVTSNLAGAEAVVRALESRAG